MCYSLYIATHLEHIMSVWFYAVLSETAGWYSTAVRARDLDAAKAKLLTRHPHATISSITR